MSALHYTPQEAVKRIDPAMGTGGMMMPISGMDIGPLWKERDALRDRIADLEAKLKDARETLESLSECHIRDSEASESLSCFKDDARECLERIKE